MLICIWWTHAYYAILSCDVIVEQNGWRHYLATGERSYVCLRIQVLLSHQLYGWPINTRDNMLPAFKSGDDVWSITVGPNNAWSGVVTRTLVTVFYRCSFAYFLCFSRLAWFYLDLFRSHNSRLCNDWQHEFRWLTCVPFCKLDFINYTGMQSLVDLINFWWIAKSYLLKMSGVHQLLNKAEFMKHETDYSATVSSTKISVTSGKA